MHCFKIYFLMVSFLIIYNPINLFSSEYIDKLHNDSKTLKTTLGIYLTEGAKLDRDLVFVTKSLDLLNTMTTDMSNLDDAMTSVDKLLDIAKEIPQTAEQASTFSTNLKTVHDPVTKASTKLTTLNNKCTGINADLKTFDTDLKAYMGKVQTFEGKLDTFNLNMDKAQRCVSSISNDSVRLFLQKKLDKVAKESDEVIVKANSDLQTIIDKVKQAKEYIDDKLANAFEPINKLDAEIVSLLDKLNALLKPLDDLEDVFNRSYTISFPYPSLKHFKIKHYDLTIGFNIILQGFDKIRSEIEHILSKALYEAAKVFGLDKLISSFIKKAQDDLMPVVNRLSFNIDLKLPGLDKLEGELDALDTLIAGLADKIKNDMTPIDNMIKSIDKDVKELENIYKNCK